MRDRSDCSSHHEGTLLPRSYISLNSEKKKVTYICFHHGISELCVLVDYALSFWFVKLQCLRTPPSFARSHLVVVAAWKGTEVRNRLYENCEGFVVSVKEMLNRLYEKVRVLLSVLKKYVTDYEKVRI